MGNKYSGSLRNEFKTSHKILDFYPNQILKLKEKFELLCDDDLGIHLDNFLKLMKFNKDQEEGKKIFNYFDYENNGKVDSYEFISCLSMLSYGSLEEKSELIFKLFDFDQSQILNFDEMVVLYRSCICAISFMSGNKVVPLIEDIEVIVKKLFETYDINNDEEISLNEFKKIITNDKDIIQFLKQFNIIKSDDFIEGINLDNELYENEPDLKKEIDYQNKEINKFNLTSINNLDSNNHKIWYKKENIEIFEKNKNEIDGDLEPQINLEMEYIYGYNFEYFRNYIKYLNNGNLVYNNGNNMVLYDQNSNSQKIFTEHNSEIISFSVCNFIIASCENGNENRIIIWDQNNFKIEVILTGIFKKGISKIEFSPTGKKLVAIGNEEFHSIVVYDLDMISNFKNKVITNENIILSAIGPKEDIYDIKFNTSENKIYFGCKKKLYYLNIEDKLVFNEIIPFENYGDNFINQSFLSMVVLNNILICGSFTGSIFKFNSEVLNNEYKAHNGLISSLVLKRNNKGFISCGYDGVIFFWDENFHKDIYVDLKSEQSLLGINYKIRSVDINYEESIVISTKGGNIIEINNKKEVKKLIDYHFEGKITCIAIHPTKNELATCSEDKQLIIWNLESKIKLKSKFVSYTLTYAEYKKDESIIALGCENGFILILETKNLNVIKIIQDKNSRISCLKFCQNNEYLVISSDDNEIIIYYIKGEFKKYFSINSHKFKVDRLCFDTESKYLVSSNKNNEIIFTDLIAKKKITNPFSNLKDIKFSDWCHPYGWQYVGLWNNNFDNYIINNIQVYENENNKNIIVSDNQGSIKIYPYPSTKDRNNYNLYKPNSSNILMCLINHNNDKLLSISDTEKSLIQWKISERNNPKNKNMIEEFKNKEINDMENNIIDYYKLESYRYEKDYNFIPKIFNILKEINKPFIQELELLKNPNSNKKKNDNIPLSNLELDYCIGLKANNVKNMIKYSENKNEILYFSSSIGIKYNKENNTQRFFQMHKKEISCLTFNSKLNIVATGEKVSNLNNENSNDLVDIYIWDINTLETINCLNGFHRREITSLIFTNNSLKLLSFGMSNNHCTFATYDWNSGHIWYKTKLGTFPIIDLFIKNDSNFVTVSYYSLKFWNIKGNSINYKIGNWDETTEKSRFTSVCIGFPKNLCVTGCHDGSLICWNNEYNINCSLKKHNNPINVVTAFKTSVFSADDNGIIIEWRYSNKLEIINEFNLQNIKISNYEIYEDNKNDSHYDVVSLDFKNDGTLLFGTKNSKIFELETSSKNLKLINDFHFYKIQKVKGMVVKHSEIWGLCCHPNKLNFVTCGDDKTVRLWNLKQKKLLKKKILRTRLRACDWSEDGNFIVVAGMDGFIYLFNSNLDLCHEYKSKFYKESESFWIQEIKFSPNNKYVLFGFHGGANEMELLSIKEDGKLTLYIQIKLKVTDSLTNFDWSKDSNTIMLNTSAFEIKFYSVSNKSFITSSAANMIKWKTWTCIYGYQVKGIYPRKMGLDVQSTCKSHNKNIAVGYYDGKIKIFRFPCVSNKSKCIELNAHCFNVTRVRWSYKDEYLISLGGEDGTIWIWKNNFTKQEIYENNLKIEEENIKKFNNYFISKNIENKLFKKESIEDNSNQIEMEKLWIGIIKPPSKFIKPLFNHYKKPKLEVDLDFVYGYRSKDCRNNILVLNKQEIIYFVSGLVIIYDFKNKKQRFFSKHDNDVSCIDINKDKIRIASGQLGNKLKIYIWNAYNLLITNKIIIENENCLGLSFIKFNPDGNKLFCSLINENNQIKIFNVKKEIELFDKYSNNNKVLDVIWINNFSFITVGFNHFYIWDFENGILNQRNIELNNLVSCAIYDSIIYFGGYDGNLYKFNDLKNNINLHKGPIDVIYVDKQYVITGGRDNIIKINSHLIKLLYTIDLNKLLHSNISNYIRAIQFIPDSNSLIFGSLSSSIYCFNVKDNKFKSGIKYEFKEIMSSHFARNTNSSNELSGLAVMENGKEILTCGEDGTLRKWNLKDNEGIILFDFFKENDFSEDNINFYKLSCLSYNPLDKKVAIGCKNGSVRIFDLKKNEQSKLIKDRSKQINELKYSPDGNFLAVGSKENYLDVYKTSDYRLKFSLRKHNDEIKNLDWSENSQYLQTNCKGWELLFWDVKQEKQLIKGSHELKDEKWSTFSCILGWPVQGIWENQKESQHVNMVERSPVKFYNEYNLLAYGNNNGDIQISRYPCLKKGAEKIVLKGHSNNIKNLKFNKNSNYLFSVGGEDQALCIWKVKKLI